MFDILRGIFIVLFIGAIAGTIAYVGDRVGHQVGRKRLTLFGIRPRYTSTIIAIGTGVVIALAVVLAATVASRQVQTALFHMNQINEQITELQQQQSELEQKVSSGRIVVPAGTPITTQIAVLPRGSSPDQRLQILHAYYDQTVREVNRTLVPLGLKPFTRPKDLNERLSKSSLVGQKMDAAVTSNDVLLFATSYQNLFAQDRINFQIQGAVDKLIVPTATPIAQLVIPSGKNVNVQLAFAQLENYVTRELVRNGMPEYFAGNPEPVKTYPAIPGMQKMLQNGNRNYVMTAFAATGIYPHTFLQTGGIPIIVTLTPAK